MPTKKFTPAISEEAADASASDSSAGQDVPADPADADDADGAGRVAVRREDRVQLAGKAPRA